MKHCAKCDRDMPVAEFGNAPSWCISCRRDYQRERRAAGKIQPWTAEDKARMRAWSAANKDHLREYWREYRIRNAERKRDQNLRLAYGITATHYDAMLEAQGGCCAACGAYPGTKRTKRLFVDHDHATGLVRGLLCQKCNHAIGLADDSPGRLRALAIYLEQHASSRAAAEEKTGEGIQ